MEITPEIKAVIAIETLRKQDCYTHTGGNVLEVEMDTGNHTRAVVEALLELGFNEHDAKIHPADVDGRNDRYKHPNFSVGEGKVFVHTEVGALKLAALGVDFPGKDALFPELAKGKSAVERYT